MRKSRTRTKAQLAADAKRTGRPPKGDEARTNAVTVKLSGREVRKWTKAAKKVRMTLREWIIAPRRGGD